MKWHKVLISDDTPLHAWMNDAGSFMQRLAEHGVHHASIDVWRQEWILPQMWEQTFLGMRPNESALVREVCIGSDEHAWLYARTIFPKAILNEKKELSYLANRSLGSVLFQDPAIKRSPLEFIYVEPAKLWQDFSIKKLKKATWIRRSLFYLNGNALLLTEIFMKDLEKLCLQH